MICYFIHFLQDCSKCTQTSKMKNLVTPLIDIYKNGVKSKIQAFGTSSTEFKCNHANIQGVNKGEILIYALLLLSCLAIRLESKPNEENAQCCLAKIFNPT